MSVRACTLALALLACSGGDEPQVDCATAAEFTLCEVEGSAHAMCIEATCTALEPRGTEAWGTGPTFPLPDTLLTDCQGPDGPIPCPGTPGDASCADTPLCGQDGQYGWDTSHDRGERFVGDGNAELVVTDTVTGLAWMGCARGQGAGCSGEAERGSWANDALRRTSA